MVSSDLSRRDALILFFGALLLRVAAFSPGRIQPSGPDGGLWGLAAVLVLSSLAAPALGAAGGHLGGRSAGWIAGGLAALCPILFRSSGLAGPTGLLFAGTAGSLWLLTKLAEGGTPLRALGVGALTGLALQASPGAAGLALAWPVATRRASWVLAVPAALVASSLFARIPVADPAAPAASITVAASSPLAAGLWTLVGLAGFGASAFAIVGIAVSIRRGLAGDRAVLVATGGAFLVSLLAGRDAPSGLAAALPGVLLLAAVGVSGVAAGPRLALPIAAQAVLVAIVFVEALLGTAPKIAGRWAASPAKKAEAWIERNVPPGSPILVEGDVHLESPGDSPGPSPVFQPIALPASGASDDESPLFYDPQVARLFTWILLHRPGGGGTDVVPTRFRVWTTEQWDAVGQFDSVDPDLGSYTIFRRPVDYEYDPASALRLVELLGAPKLNAVRDTSQAFTRWVVGCGTAFRTIGEARTAKGLLGLANTRDPSDARIHFELGLVHLQLEEVEDAKRTLLEGLDLDPFHGGMHYNLGTILEGEGRGDGAETEYRAAINLLDDPSPAIARLGALLVARGDLEGAAAELSELVARDPDGEATRFLAQVIADAQSAP